MGRRDAERAAHAAQHPQEEARYRALILRENGAPAELESGRTPAPAGDPLTVGHLLPEVQAPLPDAPGWTSVPTPGHTAGHVSLFRSADGVLLAGDAVLPRVTPTLGVNRQRRDPVGDYLAALERLGRLRPSLSLGGHDGPVADVAVRLAALTEATLEEGRRVLSLLRNGPATAWEVARRRYRERELPAAQWMQALRETRAHLDHLAAAGRVVRVGGGEVVRFSPLRHRGAGG
jgi:glyoxylase-like metal-dependent hydrolase (beta-lactamase superfamily II)